VPAERVHVIPCGVDTRWFTPPAQNDERAALIVCVARLREVKQLDVLLRACATVRDRGSRFRCVIVGEGPERAALERLRHDLQLDDVVALPGAAEQTQVREWWRRASVAALSSRSEGMPVSLMEAAACGVPAVAPAVGGIAELIEDGVTGFVTQPGDVGALAKALQEVIFNAPLRSRMRIAARRRAESRFSRATQVDRLLELWSSILN
jgi:glycosyltransferase involved in cell wall biosynthesis